MTIDYRGDAPDAESYFELFEKTGWNAVYNLRAAELRGALAASFATHAAWHGPRLVGTTRVLSDGVLYAFMVDVIVDPAYRGRGIGTRLVEKMVETCRRAGIRVIHLNAADGKEGFYVRLGFVRRGDTRPGMSLHLAEAVSV